MNQSSSTTQQTLTSMLMEAVKAASSNKQSTSEQSSNNNPCNTTSNNNNNCIDNLSMIGSANNSVINNNGVVVDQNLVMQMMRMMLSNDTLFHQQQTIVNSTSTTNLSQVNTQNTNQTTNDNLDSSQMLTMLMNNSMNNSTMSQLNHLFSNFLLGNATTNTGLGQEQSTIINTSIANISDKKMSYISMSPTFDQLIHSPQFFDNGCSTHIFIKKGNTKRKNSKEEQNWYRLLVQHQTSPNTNIAQEDSALKRMTNSHTKIVHTNKCLISTDCFYYLLVVLPSKMYSLSDLEFQLEEDNAEGKKKKKRPSSSNVSTPPFEIKLRGKDITTSTKLKQQSIQSPNTSNDISNLIAVFEIMINRKRAKTKSESTFNIHLTCKQEKLIKMSIDLNEIGKQNDCDEILDLAEDVNVSVKKRKKESALFDQDEEESDNPLDSTTDSARKRTKSNNTKESTFDLLKQWIIVTVFHDSLNVDLTKFPNFAFPKELFLNETFLLYVDVPTQLSEYHDICFKILDAESKQELSFNGEKWIDTNVINCCNFNIQASLVSLHVEYSISFRDINHDKPLVFVVALKDKNTEEERVIYNGSPFKIQKQAESIDELGISTIHYSAFSGFESLTEPTIISEIFDEIPILNGESLFSEVTSPTLSANFVPASESEDIMDDFERFLDM